MEEKMIEILKILGPIRRVELRERCEPCDVLRIDDLTEPRFPAACEFLRIALLTGRHAEVWSMSGINAGKFCMRLFCDPGEFHGVGEVQP